MTADDRRRRVCVCEWDAGKVFIVRSCDMKSIDNLPKSPIKDCFYFTIPICTDREVEIEILSPTIFIDVVRVCRDGMYFAEGRVWSLPSSHRMCFDDTTSAQRTVEMDHFLGNKSCS